MLYSESLPLAGSDYEYELNEVTTAGMVPKSENWSVKELVNAMLNLKRPENPCALQHEVID
jgi:hypothetical protein